MVLRKKKKKKIQLNFSLFYDKKQTNHKQNIHDYPPPPKKGWSNKRKKNFFLVNYLKHESRNLCEKVILWNMKKMDSVHRTGVQNEADKQVDHGIILIFN